jgi:hypothetical protein
MIPQGLSKPLKWKSKPEVLNDALGINFMSGPLLTSELIRAARALLRWEQRDLAEVSLVSLPTIKRLESKPGILAAHDSTVAALKRALESAGIEFVEENGGGAGVRLHKAAK